MYGYALGFIVPIATVNNRHKGTIKLMYKKHC